jgi:FtsK/SpoIIIE family
MRNRRAAHGPAPRIERAAATARRLWALRVELLRVGLIAAGALLAADLFGGRLAVVLLVVVGLSLLIPERSRAWLCWRLYVLHVRRWWNRTAPLGGLATPDGRVAKVHEVTRTAAGEALLLRLPVGQSVPWLAQRADVLATAAGVREVTVAPGQGNARFAHVTLVRRDPLDVAGVLTWPSRDARELSLWDPLPVGLDERGQLVRLRLPERNVLLGGEPGAGKSAALSMLVAAAALDPSVRLWLLDGKLVELAPWAPCAERTAGIEIEDAIELLRALRAEMDGRYDELLERGLRKITPDHGLPLHMVVCDELAFYLTAEDRKQRTAFAELLRDLVARGRAAGIIVAAATQKPAADVVPSALRDLFGFRWALRCNTPQASDTILGQGWASAGYNAARINPSQRGVGYLLAEDGLPVRMRACYLDDSAVDELARRATALRES